MWARIVRPDVERGFVTARLETVRRRNGVASDDVLWQIVTRVGAVREGAGVCSAAGHAPVPTTTASPVWRMWPRKSLADLDLGFRITARVEIVVRTHGFDMDGVLWQIVKVPGEAAWPLSRPSAVATTPTKSAGTAAAIAINIRFNGITP